MDVPNRRPSDWPLAGVCIGISGFGLSAVPFIGTRYGDWPEAVALAIGLLPLIYLAVHMATRFNERLINIESRLRELEAGRK
jgi:peptidoglycan/LPS O-acetylase OafA/YrhL